MGTEANTPDPLKVNKTGPLQIAEVLIESVAASLAPTQIGDATFVAVPNTFKHLDITEAIEKAQRVPSRKRGTVQLFDLDSLIQHAKDQANATDGYIYASPADSTITAVFNDQRCSVPGWRDHRAYFKAEYTPEFSRWLSNSGKQKDQTAFAEFIEDNLADITEPGAQTLLDVATTIQANTSITFGSAKRLQDGQVQLQYTEVIDATAGAGGALSIPKTFKIGLRVFQRGEGYMLTARLKYRLAGGKVSFWYELDRPEATIEAAFNGYVAQLRAESGYTVLMGKP